jgi:hypothetical protein
MIATTTTGLAPLQLHTHHGRRGTSRADYVIGSVKAGSYFRIWLIGPTTITTNGRARGTAGADFGHCGSTR